MPELFVELLCEEIPARMQRRAAQDWRALVTDHLVEAGLTYDGAMATATPRRLVLSVSGLPAQSADRVEERKGPRVGAPDKAVEGFLRASGLASLDEATVQTDPKKGDFYVARKTIPGRPAIEIAAEAIGEGVKRFPWPVSMRWGAASIDAGSLRWVRPLTSIVATFGAENEDPEIVPVSLPGVPVGDTTVGHRIHAPGQIRVRRLDDYKTALNAANVVVDHDRRRDQIVHDAKDAAFALGLELVEDERLLEEVAGLVEWPVVLVGRFEEEALRLPDEVIRLTIRENQKCFVTRDPATGRLSNAFVLTANLDASDGGAAVIAGNERVVRARLADARFFWEQDLKLSLDAHAKTLQAVTFHERLGTQAERVDRIASLAKAIAARIGADPDMAERAARLAKADLPTQMVGEFPELQGYMGRRYAEAAGEPAEIVAAIEDHYSPLGPSDAVPAAPVSIAVALADKLDSFFWLWAAGEKPSGSGDAFGLRRAALGIIRIILSNGLRLPVSDGTPDAGGLVGLAWSADHLVEARNGLWEADASVADVASGDRFAAFTRAEEPVAFMRERFVVQQRDAGVPADVVRAVLKCVAATDLVDLSNRITALRAFLATNDGAQLMAGYRRAVNILRAEEKKDGPVSGAPNPTVLVEPSEIALADAVEVARGAVSRAITAEDYGAAMAAIATLRGPVDHFFEAVMVNADDPTLRGNRLRLLAALRDLTRHVADFSEISG